MPETDIRTNEASKQLPSSGSLFNKRNSRQNYLEMTNLEYFMVERQPLDIFAPGSNSGRAEFLRSSLCLYRSWKLIT